MFTTLKKLLKEVAFSIGIIPCPDCTGKGYIKITHQGEEIPATKQEYETYKKERSRGGRSTDKVVYECGECTFME